EMNRAVSATNNDAVVTGMRTISSGARQICGTRAGVNVELCPAVAEVTLDFVDAMASPASSRSRVVEEQETHSGHIQFCAMKSVRTLFVVFALAFACKPFAESRAVDPVRAAEPPIPPSVSAVRRSPIAVVAHNVLPSVVNIQTEATIRRREVDPFFD